MQHPYLSLPVIAKSLETAACVQLLQALCKDHLGCSCLPERELELGPKLPRSKPSSGKTVGNLLCPQTEWLLVPRFLHMWIYILAVCNVSAWRDAACVLFSDLNACLRSWLIFPIQFSWVWTLYEQWLAFRKFRLFFLNNSNRRWSKQSNHHSNVKQCGKHILALWAGCHS